MGGKRLTALVLALVLFLCAVPDAYAAPGEESQVYIQKMLNGYRCIGKEASSYIAHLLRWLEHTDETQAKAWRQIMNTWMWVDTEMEPEYDVLPDGLPEEETLGIVVMGFALNEDGTMQPELEQRLEVALASAQKYPDSVLIVTGGPTAANSGNTEAGVMARWLMDRGIPGERIILDHDAYSTAENALNVYRILLEDDRNIRKVALITSDYHIYRSYMDFYTVSAYYSTVEAMDALELVGYACCDPGESHTESLYSHMADICYITGVEMKFEQYPKRE